MEMNARACALEVWLRHCGGRLHPTIQVSHSPTSGYNLHTRPGFATARLPQQPPLVDAVVVPFYATLSALDTDRAGVDWPDAFIAQFEDAPEALTRFLLAEEYLRVGESFWAPYIETLPRPPRKGDEGWQEEVSQCERLHTPLWYDEEDELFIEGTNLHAAAKKLEDAWRREFEAGMIILRKHRCSLSQVTGSYGWILYKWASTILTSRSFPSSLLHGYSIPSGRSDVLARSSFAARWRDGSAAGFPVLIPVVDHGNHSRTAHVSWETDGRTFVLRAHDALEPDQEVFNNYGPKSADELMLGYGFCPVDPDVDIFALAITIPPNAPNPHDKPSPSSRPDTRTFHLHPHTPPCFPTALITFLTPLVANARESTHYHSSPSDAPGHSNGSTDTYSPSATRSRTAIAAQLLFSLRRHLSRLNKHTPRLPSSGPKNQRQANALRYRNGQRRVLELHCTALTLALAELRSRGQLLSLADVLEESPECVAVPFRAAVRAGFGTRRAEKLSAMGVAEAVWVLWVCTVWMVVPELETTSESKLKTVPSSEVERMGETGTEWSAGEGKHRRTDSPEEESELLDEEPILHRLQAWKSFLIRAYELPSGWPEQKAENFTPGNQMPSGRSGTPVAEDGGETDDSGDKRVAASYLSIVEAAAERDPEGIYADERWTMEYLAWGLHVLREETVRVPKGVAVDVDEGEDDADTEPAEEDGGELMLLLEPREALDLGMDMASEEISIRELLRA